MKGRIFVAEVRGFCSGVERAIRLVEQALDSLIDRGGVVQEQVANVEGCYLRRLWEAEVTACARLNALLSAPPDVG